MALFIHKTILGDAAKCAVYLSFALSKVRHLHQIKSVQTQSFELDGVRIRCHVVGDQGYIRLDGGCAVYIESGALDIGHHSRMYVEQTDRCTVYKAGLSDTVTDTALLNVALVGKLALPNNDPESPSNDPVDNRSWYKSNIFRLKDPPTPLPIVPLPRQEDFVDLLTDAPDVPAWKAACYPDHAALLLRKIHLDFLNPSKATGKMRMFLQAVFGCSLVNTITLNTGPLIIRNKTIAYMSTYLPVSTSNYIIRDDNGIYWMMDKTQAYRMNFSRCGDEALAKLRGGGLTREQESVLEAVLFSYFYVSQPTQEVIDAANDRGMLAAAPGWYPCAWPTITGGTLQYDWHFAYQQPKAISVTHGVSIPAPPINYKRSRAYFNELTFSTAGTVDAPLPPTPSLRILEEANWSVQRAVNIEWRIDPYTGTQFVDMPLPFEQDGACDAPVYAFYDKDDNPIVVRYSKTDPLTAVAAPAMVGLDTLFACGYGEEEVEGVDFGAVIGGYYVLKKGAVVWDGRAKTCATSAYSKSARALPIQNIVYVDIDGVGSGYYIGPGCHPGEVAVSFGGLPQLYVVSYYGRVTTYDISGAGSTNTESSFILFPLNNPDAIYIGKRHRKTVSGSEGFTFRDVVDFIRHVVNGVEYIQHWAYSWSGGGALGSGVTFLDSATTSEDVKLVTQHSISTLSSFQNYAEARDHVVTIPEKLSEWAEIFSPSSYTATWWSRKYDVRESINGRLWYSSDIQTTSVIPAEVPKDRSLYFTGYA